MALTTRDLEILSAAFQCLKDPDAFKVGQLIIITRTSCNSVSLFINLHLKPFLLLCTHSSQSITVSLKLTVMRTQVDYQKLATLAGFKTAASASNSFFLVKKKINAGASAGALAKEVTADDAEADDNAAEAGDTNHDEGPTTPVTPKKRGRKAKATPTSAKDGNVVTNDKENGDEPTEPTPATTPKKRARKPKAETKSGDEATTPKKRVRKAAKPKAEKDKVETPNSGGDEEPMLPTPASPSPVKKRVRKPKEDSGKPASAKRAKKSAEFVAADASADEEEINATAAATIANMADAKLGGNVAPNNLGRSTVLAAELAAAAVNEYSKGGQSDVLAPVTGDDDVSEGETMSAAGKGLGPA